MLLFLDVVSLRVVAVEFLLSHNYRMDAPFMRGIKYLSWEEEARAREIAAEDWNRDSFVDIGIRKDDLENLRLMQQVREDIAIWMMRSAVSSQTLSFLPLIAAPPPYVLRFSSLFSVWSCMIRYFM